jgi:hypothetical protein
MDIIFNFLIGCLIQKCIHLILHEILAKGIINSLLETTNDFDGLGLSIEAYYDNNHSYTLILKQQLVDAFEMHKANL